MSIPANIVEGREQKTDPELADLKEAALQPRAAESAEQSAGSR
jgi:hypothetical protein